MGAIRTLYTDLKLRSADALKGLVAYGKQWQTIEKVVANAATSIERNADRAAAAMARMATGAARAGGGGGGGGPRAPNPARDAARKAREDAAQARLDAREQAAAQRFIDQQAAKRAREANKRDAIGANSGRLGARAGGLADGSKAIREATAALGPLATKSDRAKAAVADLAAQVARNRKELTDLRVEAVKSGDASGTLKARMQGLSVATAQAGVALQKARKDLRDVDGGLIDAVKNAGKLRERFGALRVAAGTLIADGVKAGVAGVGAALAGAAKKAIDFESAMADVKKVLPDGTTVEQIGAVEKSIVDLSRRVAVDGPEGAAKLNAALLQTGLYTTETLVPAAEAAAKVGVAFDISAGEAGDALAKLRVGGNLTQEQVERLAGTFNHLSNNMPATARQIIDAESRVVSIGNAANISAEQTTALVTAMIATGADADVAATGTKNFIKALGAGEAATKKQRHALQTLGLDARDVAKGLTAGGKSAEETVKGVVSRIGELGKTSREKVLPVLIELFGSESISSIGPLATNIDLLTKSFDLAGDSAAATASIEKEYAARSKTTANAIQLLKNNVSALAIEFGNALLPYINEVVAFLTSPEGQEWGRAAVERAVGAVTTLSSAIGRVVEFIGGLVDAFGGATLAVAGLGLAAASLTGPFGIALAAGTAAGFGIAAAFKSALDTIRGVEGAIPGAVEKARTQVGLATQKAELDAEAAGGAAQHDVSAKVRDLEARYGAQLEREGVGPMERTRRVAALSLAVAGKNRNLGGGTSAERVAEWEKRVAEDEGIAASFTLPGAGGGAASRRPADQARFAALSARVRKGERLKPSEAAEYTALSKSLDEAKARKAGKGHKATKMDRQLAAIGGDVRGVLTGGGERDAGGDLMVHDDVLSRSVLARSSASTGGLGSDRSDGAGIGPGPSISNHYDNRQYNTQIDVDARGRESSADNLRSSANVVASRLQVVFTGGARVKAEANAGGVLRGPR